MWFRDLGGKWALQSPSYLLQFEVSILATELITNLFHFFFFLIMVKKSLFFLSTFWPVLLKERLGERNGGRSDSQT